MSDQKNEKNKAAQNPEAPKDTASKGNTPAKTDNEQKDAPAEGKPLDEKLDTFKGEITGHVVTKEDIENTPELEGQVKPGEKIDLDKPEEQDNAADGDTLDQSEDRPEETAEELETRYAENIAELSDQELDILSRLIQQEKEKRNPSALGLVASTDKEIDEAAAASADTVKTEESEDWKQSVLERRENRKKELQDPNRVPRRKKF